MFYLAVEFQGLFEVGPRRKTLVLPHVVTQGKIMVWCLMLRQVAANAGKTKIFCKVYANSSKKEKDLTARLLQTFYMACLNIYSKLIEETWRFPWIGILTSRYWSQWIPHPHTACNDQKSENMLRKWINFTDQCSSQILQVFLVLNYLDKFQTFVGFT